MKKLNKGHFNLKYLHGLLFNEKQEIYDIKFLSQIFTDLLTSVNDLKTKYAL